MTQAQGSGNLAEFLLARIAEDEAVVAAGPSYVIFDASPHLIKRDGHEPMGYVWAGREYGEDLSLDPSRLLAECEAKRRIVDWHQNWPVLAEGPTKIETDDDDGLTGMTLRMSRQMAWMTEQQYRETFGSEPPTGPILRFLALPYADHPDYREEWKP